MLGQVGLPGGAVFGFGYSATNTIGLDYQVLSPAALPQGQNAVDCFIPVARISDMLLNPGGTVDYKGQKLTYPEIKAIYWARRQPVPPSPGPKPDAACLAEAGHHHLP